MLSLIVKVAGIATATGFAAGIYAHRKANHAKEVVKEKFKTMETHTVRVHVPKGTDLDKCKVKIYVPVEDED